MSNPETVVFNVSDQDNNPIAGVLIRVYDAAGAVFQTQQYTDVNGVAEVDGLLGDNPAIPYTIRMSKTGAAFDGSLGDASKTPLLITVFSPPSAVPGGNSFEIKGETFTRPVSPDLRLCRCSGFFKDITGKPLPGLEIKFINEFGPTVVTSIGSRDGYAVMGEGVNLITDQYGYACIDLYRNGQYEAWVSGVQAADSNSEHAIGFPRNMVIPDQGSANLVSLLFPVVSNVSVFPNPITLLLNQAINPSVVVTADDGRILVGTACEDVYYEVQDKSIAGISVTIDKMSLVGINPGITQLLAVRKDQTIVKIPAASLFSSPVIITVT